MNPIAQTTCKCRHCSASIEFDSFNFQPGQSVICLQCGLETELYLKSPSRFAPPIPPAPVIIHVYCEWARVPALICFAFGPLILFSGFLWDFAATTVFDESEALFIMFIGCFLFINAFILMVLGKIFEAIANKKDKP